MNNWFNFTWHNKFLFHCDICSARFISTENTLNALPINAMICVENTVYKRLSFYSQITYGPCDVSYEFTKTVPLYICIKFSVFPGRGPRFARDYMIHTTGMNVSLCLAVNTIISSRGVITAGAVLLRFATRYTQSLRETMKVAGENNRLLVNGLEVYLSRTAIWERERECPKGRFMGSIQARCYPREL